MHHVSLKIVDSFYILHFDYESFLLEIDLSIELDFDIVRLFYVHSEFVVFVIDEAFHFRFYSALPVRDVFLKPSVRLETELLLVLVQLFNDHSGHFSFCAMGPTALKTEIVVVFLLHRA